MEPALDVIDRSLRGDAEARSFLERTSSIYVIHVSNTASPKTYGCWNFIHQALNEVERFEARAQQRGTSSKGSEGLVHHSRLLASMALRVARRSPASERFILSNCIANAADFQCSENQSQWLIDLNFELREIVMGRIAAMALDFSFHRRVGHCAYSSFADKVVLDSFCAVLSANAVSTGPQGIRHFATEWIIPSSKNIPIPALVSVVRHLGHEGQRISAPVGVKDVLQQLSVQIMSICVLPILSDAVSDNATQTDTTLSLHRENASTAATALQAIKAWMDATELSLPQLRHICSKANLDVLEVLSNAMYSDSRDVIDALAELVEASCHGTGCEAISEGRMNQVRYIIQVDQSSFHSSFGAQQLASIETKEMKAIVEELAFAIGLQRARFITRQEQGDHDVCRNLARIASTIATSCWKTDADGSSQHLERGLLEILLKAAASPRIQIASISLNALSMLLGSMNSLCRDALPILQRRAIIPHEISSGMVELQTESFSNVSFEDFLDFRDHVLTDALVACCQGDGHAFFESCTSAVEEFCGEGCSVEVSLFLEAAIFCIEAVGDTVMSSHRPFPHGEQLKRCTHALVSRSKSLVSSPLTLTRMANMLEKYAVWYRDEDGIHTAADLIALGFTDNVGFAALKTEQDQVDPLAASCHAMQTVLSACPRYFSTETRLGTLAGLWKACHIGGSAQQAVDACSRRLFGRGLCKVIALLSDEGRISAFETLLSFPQSELEKQIQLADNAVDDEAKRVCLEKVSGEIYLIASLCWSFTNSGTNDDSCMESGCPSSPDRHELIPPSVLSVARCSWPKIIHVASAYARNETVSKSICSFLVDFLPPTVRDDYSLELLKDLAGIASSMIATGVAGIHLFESLCDFLSHFIMAHGHTIDEGTESVHRGSKGNVTEREIFRLAESLFLDAIEYARPSLGDAWNKPTEQGQGQPPYESHDASTPKLSESTKDCLAALLPLLRVCLDHAPVFLLHLPAHPGVDGERDMLFRRAVISTVESLNETDPDLASNAITLLETMVKQNSSRNEDIRRWISEELSRVHRDVLNSIFVGCCGNYELKVVGKVASFLCTLLCTSPTAELEAEIAGALRNEDFMLGEEAVHVCMNVFAQCARRSLGQEELRSFLEKVWTIHRAEDRNALAQSDAVDNLIRSYRPAL